MHTANTNGQSPYKKGKLLKFHDRLMKKGRKVLDSRCGKEMAGPMAAEIRSEFTELIPRIPYIGGAEPWTRQLFMVTVFLAIYRVLKRREWPVGDIWQVCSDTAEAMLNTLPGFLKKRLREWAFAEKQLNTYRKQEVEFEKRQHPDGDVFTLIDGEGQDFDYGMDITECAKCKFYRREGAEELLPYICLTDKVWADVLGYGLVRTQTLADGDVRCDFRLTKEGRTDVASSVLD
ncbi:MAG: L-2-amino-thiazoline-4-carboxylic acid hydrolase [Spirochaetia bacterium]